ncbi:MAG: hypothetical protein ACFFDT_38585 [Candidatus Hodarchaeota archaeon]
MGSSRNKKIGKQKKKKKAQDHILIVEGDLDNVSIDLVAGIITTHTNPSKLSNFDIQAFDMMIICSPGRFIETRSVRKIQIFVLKGKPLLTSDWCLNTVIERIAPGFIQHNGKFTKREEIDLELKNPDHFLVQGINQAIFQNKCIIQAKTMPFEVLTDEVEVLTCSKILKRRYDSEACLVAFPKGQGLIYIPSSISTISM